MESEVAALKQQAETLRAAQQRAEAQLEAAQAEEARLLARLSEEFGVSSLEEGQALLSKLDAELSSEIAAVRSALEQTRKEES